MASLKPASQEGLCLQPLAVALQHPAVAADQRNICTLLRVNKILRTTVQQSAASLTDIRFCRRISLRDSTSINAVSSFARWLAQHPGLIGNLSISPDCIGLQQSVAEEIAQPLIELGLRAAAAATQDATPPPVAANNHVRHQLPFGLRMRSFISSVPPTAAMLAALPAATLTSLELDKVNNSDWYLGLSQLINLQQMRLNMKGLEPQHSAVSGCFIATSNLWMLTALKLQGVPSGFNTMVLPVQLQELDLTYGHHFLSTDPALEADRGAVVDLQHLTRLQQLQLHAPELAPGSSVPGNLSCLKLSVRGWEAEAVSGLSSLNQLTSVELNIQYLTIQHLQPFKQLRQLQRLSVEVGEDANPLELADAWRDLPLCSLQFWRRQMMTYSNVKQLMRGIGQAATLTKLDLGLPDIVPDDADAEKLAVCEHLSTLTNLQKLALSIKSPERFVEHDAQHLAALVRLTSLDLCNYNSGPYLDATTLCLLAACTWQVVGFEGTKSQELQLLCAWGQQYGSTSCHREADHT